MIGRLARIVPILAFSLLGLGFSPEIPGESASSSEPTLASLLADFRLLAPVPEGIPLRDRNARIGHLELSFHEGVLYPLRTPRGATLGFFFAGRGHYVYRSEDPGDRQTLPINVAKHAVVPHYRNFTVSDAFDRMVLFFAAPLFQDLWDPGNASGQVADSPPTAGHAAARGADARSAFEKIWQRIQMSYLEWDHLAAEVRLNPGRGSYLYGEIDGKLKTVGYSYDGVRQFEERLFLFRNEPLVNLRQRDPLSSQPIDGGVIAQPPELLLKDIQLRILTEDNRTGRISSDLTLEAGRDRLRAARLALINNGNPYSADWSSDRNRLRIRRVSDEAGRDLAFSHRYHEVLVELPRVFSRGEFLNLRFETEGEIFTGFLGDRADSYFDLFGAPWFPSPSGWSEAGYSFGLKIRTRKPYRPIASGTTTAFRELGDFYELETESTRPMRGIAVFAGKYVTREEKLAKRTLRVHAYATARKEVLEAMPNLAHGFLSFYETVLGSYPYDELDIVEVPYLTERFLVGLGIATPGLVLLTSEAYRARGQWQTEYMSRGINSRLAHEIAHQWFGHKAMPASPRDSWLAESFAEYLSGLAMAAARPDEARVVGFTRMFAEWRAGAKYCEDAGPIEAANLLSGEAGWEKRRCLLYDRGPLVLHMLHTMIGTERFFAVLRSFLDKADSGLATTADLEQATAQVLQSDMSWFFDQWYRGGGTPVVQIERHLEPLADGKFALTGRVLQPDGAEFRRMVIPLVLEYSDGRRDARLLFQDKAVIEFRFELPEKPHKVLVDPAQNNLAVYR